MNHLRVENKLLDTDFAKLLEVFSEGSVDSVQLLPAIDYGFVKTQPLVISGYEKGYVISTRMFFSDPVGNTVFVNAGIEEIGIWKLSKRVELCLRKPLGSCEDLGKDIAYGLLLVEKVVNYVCMLHVEAGFKEFVVDSTIVDKQINRERKKKEIESMHEKLEPFAMAHGNSGKDLNIQAHLIPLFWEYDKYDLYGKKKAFCMLPRDFVTTLLKCDPSALIPQEQFSKAGKKVLDYLIERKFLKKREVAGKTYYFDLSRDTRTSLIKALRTRADE